MGRPAPKTKGATGRPRRYFVLSDCHHDDEGRNNDAALWAATMALLDDAAGTTDGVLLNGDFIEGSCGSAHVPDHFKASYEADTQAAFRAASQVRLAVGRKTRIVWLSGNHETAAVRALMRSNASFVTGFWDRWRRDVGLDELGIEWLDETRVFADGRLRILHGHQVPGRLLPKHHAAKVAELYGGPGLVIGFGHSHREGMAVRPSHEGNCLCFALPAMRTLDPGWTLGAPNGWGQGLAEALVWPDGHADLRVIRWAGRRMEYGGRVYR